MKKLIKSQRFYVMLLLAFTAVIMSYRSYYRQAKGDEAIYEYVWEKDDSENLWNPKHRYERKIGSFADVVQSQIMHYKYVNGRSLVHAVEQAFTNHKLAFGIVNSLIFILFCALIVFFIKGSYAFLASYPLWFITLFGAIFLLPGGLWVSINGAPNYLWPSTLSVAFFILWNKLEYKGLKRYLYPIIALMSFILGWSHEGFSLPIIGGFVLYYFFFYNQFNKRLLWLFIPLLIGALILVVSPGNFNRLGEKSHIETIRDAFVHLTYLKMFWIMMACLLLIWLGKGYLGLKAFIKNNIKIFLIFSISFAFTLIANTGPWTNTFMEVLAFLIVLRYLRGINFYNKRWVKIACVVLTFVYIPQQILLARDCVALYKYQHAAYLEYVESPDGYVKFEEPEYSIFTKPYLSLFENNRNVFSTKMHLVNGTPNKIPLLIGREDYLAVEFPDSFYIPENHLSGTAPMYYIPGGEYYWVHPDSIDKAQNLVANWYPVDWNHDVILIMKIKYALMPRDYPLSTPINVDTVQTRFGPRYRIPVIKARHLRSIDLALSK